MIRSISFKQYRRVAALLWCVGALGASTGCAPQVLPSRAPASWLGLDTHLGYPDYDGRWLSAKTLPEDREIYFGLIGQLGVSQVRDLAMSWAAIEPRQGRYDFSLADDLVRRAQTFNVHTLALCWGIPRWAAARAEGGTVDLGVPNRSARDAFAAFVRAFVERYDGDGLRDMPGLRVPVNAYEFMNEPENVGADEYAYWLKIFHDAVKSADSHATVVLGSLKSPGVKIADQPQGDYETFFERLLGAEQLQGPHFPYFDVVGFHNIPADYPGRSEFDDALAYLRRVMAEHTLARPVWLTGYGSDSGKPNNDRGARLQAANIVKWALRARALGIERVFLHSLWDYHWPGDTGIGENVGLVREVASGEVPPRKPAFEAFATLAREINRRPRVTSRGTDHYMLSGAATPVYCLWRESGSDPPPAFLSDWWEVRTLAGRKSTQLGASIKLDSEPRFLERVSSPFMDGAPQFK